MMWSNTLTTSSTISLRCDFKKKNGPELVCYYLQKHHPNKGRLEFGNQVFETDYNDWRSFGWDLTTMNFSWQNKIGNGLYGNVYNGILPDGSEVALKSWPIRRNIAIGTACGLAYLHHTEAMFVALGVVLLELLSGNRALISDKIAFDAVEYNMPMLGPPEEHLLFLPCILNYMLGQQWTRL
ncbi:hypothetical protein AAG906_012571 [Vitis piasezkii]